MPRAAAASMTGTATYPPVAKTIRGRRRPRARKAATMPAGTLTKRSTTFCHATARRSLPVGIA